MLKELCDKYNFEYVECPYEVTIKTLIADWKFNPSERPYRLYHRPLFAFYKYAKKHYTQRTQNDGFHYQHKNFGNIEHLIRYIYKHDGRNWVTK